MTRNLNIQRVLQQCLCTRETVGVLERWGVLEEKKKNKEEKEKERGKRGEGRGKRGEKREGKNKK